MIDSQAKVAQLRRLRSMMRQLIAQEKAEKSAGDESPGSHPGMDDLQEELPDMSPDDQSAEGSDPGDSGDPVEDELTRMKRDYFRPKPRLQRPGTAMVVSVSAEKEPKKPGHMAKRSMRF